MQLPALLSRRKKNVHKNTFGHVLILAGSRTMMGAATLTSLAAMRSGAGLATLGVPKSLNTLAQKKISPVVMTLPLNETKELSLSINAYNQIKKKLSSFDVIAIGPGLSQNKSTQSLILKIISSTTKPIVIDADALNAVSKNPKVLLKKSEEKILTPHPREMARLTGIKKGLIGSNRKKSAKEFAGKYKCTVLLKGHRTVVAHHNGQVYINKTGNPGMATAGSGDVLTGIIAAFLGQGLSGFQAAKYGAYIHGKAGDLAAKKKSKTSMIASDIINEIPKALHKKLKS